MSITDDLHMFDAMDEDHFYMDWGTGAMNRTNVLLDGNEWQVSVEFQVDDNGNAMEEEVLGHYPTLMTALRVALEAYEPFVEDGLKQLAEERKRIAKALIRLRMEGA